MGITVVLEVTMICAIENPRSVASATFSTARVKQDLFCVFQNLTTKESF